MEFFETKLKLCDNFHLKRFVALKYRNYYNKLYVFLCLSIFCSIEKHKWDIKKRAAICRSKKCILLLNFNNISIRNLNFTPTINRIYIHLGFKFVENVINC